ncbi:hypothetical protein VN97_g11565, partial [Penicillium thymicola]
VLVGLRSSLACAARLPNTLVN